MKIDKRFICSIIFNLAETALIFLVGKLLQLPTNHIIIVMLTFMISRGCFGKALHFKTWYRCLVWSLLILLTLFLILKVDLVISILFTIFSAFVMTGKSNIEDIYLWKPKGESNFSDIEEYVKYNKTNPDLLEFEESLKKRDNLLYLIYKYRFIEKLTYKEISDKLDGMENPRITEKLNQIALAIRIHCGI